MHGPVFEWLGLFGCHFVLTKSSKYSVFECLLYSKAQYSDHDCVKMVETCPLVEFSIFLMLSVRYLDPHNSYFYFLLQVD